VREKVRRFGPVLGALIGCGLGLLVLQQVTTGAFEDLEARQVGQDADLHPDRAGRSGPPAHRLRLDQRGLGQHVPVLKNADRAGFAEDFPAGHPAFGRVTSTPSSASASTATSSWAVHHQRAGLRSARNRS
jgi:hypothetical protein